MEDHARGAVVRLAAAVSSAITVWRRHVLRKFRDKYFDANGDSSVEPLDGVSKAKTRENSHVWSSSSREAEARALLYYY